MIRQIVLDTETTGMNRTGVRHEGHAIIEIGAVEIVNRRLSGQRLHVYLRPDRKVDAAAVAIHGITDLFLADRPTFAHVAPELLAFIQGAELIAHNAPFDIGFIDYEYQKLVGEWPKVETICHVIDTLAIARQLFPGKRNSLDALCQRYQIDNTQRNLHGALLDAALLAEVYLAMTGGQVAFQFATTLQQVVPSSAAAGAVLALPEQGRQILYATQEELDAHRARLEIVKQQGESCLWLQHE